MPKSYRILTLLLLCLTTVLFTSCTLPLSVAPVINSQTPTSPAKPTTTSTFTSTATPLPPLTIAPCPEDCSGAVMIDSLISGDMESGVEYIVDVPVDQPVRFALLWLMHDLEQLAENTQYLHFFFEIDGQNYWSDSFLDAPQTFFDESRQKEYALIWAGVQLSGWQIGQPHHVRIGFRNDEQSSSSGAAVTSFFYDEEYLYTLNPVVPPADTPTPRPTEPRPTSPAVTPTTVCVVDSNININNNTGGKLRLNLSGPADYSFSLEPGGTSLSVCSGTYTYFAYGCGNATRMGKINSGDGAEFSCVSN